MTLVAEQAAPMRRSRRRVLAALLILQGLAVLSLAPWWLMAIFAPMLSDGGVSPTVYVLIYGIWSYPLYLLALATASWVCFSLGRHRAAVWLAALLLLPAVLMGLGSLLPG